MITSVFKKSTPLNYSLAVILILIFFFLYQIQDPSWMESYFLCFQKVSMLCFVYASFFVINFIVKKNGFNRDNGYAILFYLCLSLFFPGAFDNYNVLYANFFIMLSIRRLLSLQSLKNLKEKIFDASFWILVATLFQFWSILLMLLVYLSIVLHASRDYRNYVLPFVAVLCVGILFYATSLLCNFDMIAFFNDRAVLDFRVDYFENNYQNAALSIYVSAALFIITVTLMTFTNRPQIVHSSFKKIIIYFFIAVIVFLISPDKSNDLVLLTVPAIAIMGASYVEHLQEKINQEIVLGILIICSLFTFFSQL